MLTPLERAASGDVSGVQDVQIIISLLSDAGADPNQRDTIGWTCLHGAACLQSKDRSHLIDVLVQHGADVNVRNKKGRTPLHLSMKAVNPAAFFLRLLRAGADPRILDNQGKTALGRLRLTHARCRVLRKIPREVRRLIADYKLRRAALDSALERLADETEPSHVYANLIREFTEGVQRLEALEALLEELSAMLRQFAFPISPATGSPRSCGAVQGSIMSSDSGTSGSGEEIGG